MNFARTHQDLTETLQTLISRAGTGDLRDADAGTGQDIAEHLERMATHLAAMPLPLAQTAFSGNAHNASAARNDLMDNHVIRQPNHQRRLLMDYLNHYAEPLSFNADYPGPIRSDLLFARWSEQGAALADLADSASQELIDSPGAYTDHSASIFPPERVIDHVGIGADVDGRFPTDYDLAYIPIGAGRHQNQILAETLVEQIQHVASRDTGDDQNTSAIRAFIPATSNTNTAHAPPALSYPGLFSGQPDAPVAITYSTSSPETLTVCAQNCRPIEVPTPQALGIRVDGDGQDLDNYAQAIISTARTQPARYDVRAHELRRCQYRLEALEQISATRLVDDASLADDYAVERDDIQYRLKRLAYELDPNHPDDRADLRKWSYLYARAGGDDTASMRFGGDRYCNTFPSDLMPSHRLHFEGHGPETEVHLVNTATGQTQTLDPDSINNCGGTGVSRHALAHYLKHVHDLTHIRQASSQTTGGTVPEHESVWAVSPQTSGLKPLGWVTPGKQDQRLYMSPYEALNTIERDQDGVRWRYRISHNTEQVFELMNDLAAYGARDMLTGEDLSIAEGRVDELEQGIRGAGYVDIAYHDGQTACGERSDEAAIPMTATRLDLIHGDEGNLRHRLAVAAATHPNIDPEHKPQVVREIETMDQETAQQHISAAVEQHTAGQAPGL